MTLGEFKAWVEGFEESFLVAPSHEQWNKIKEKLAEVQVVDTIPYSPNPPYITAPGSSWTTPFTYFGNVCNVNGDPDAPISEQLNSV